MAEQKYTIGDIVTIKKLTRDDKGLYRFGLNDDMISLSGESLEVIGVEEATASSGKIPDDGWKYRLRGSPWSWASSMFEDTSEASIVHGVIETKDSSIDAFINEKKCPVLDFTL